MFGTEIREEGLKALKNGKQLTSSPKQKPKCIKELQPKAKRELAALPVKNRECLQKQNRASKNRVKNKQGILSKRKRTRK
ncbi:MAG: hypothetical protein IJK02_03335 [Clostridia bacterium]|nr:hypothetical protein [Clostridia bacterium]